MGINPQNVAQLKVNERFGLFAPAYTGQSLGDPEELREFALSDRQNARLRENFRGLWNLKPKKLKYCGAPTAGKLLVLI